MQTQIIRRAIVFALAGAWLLGPGPRSYGQGAPDVVWSDAGPTNKVLALAFSPDGQWLAAGSGADIRWWLASSGVPVGVVNNDAVGVWNLWFRSDGTLLSWDRAAQLKRWRLADRSLLSTLSFPVEYGGSGSAFSEARESLAALRFDTRMTSVWRVGDGSLEASWFSDAPLLAFSPDGSELATGYFYGSLGIYTVSLRSADNWTERLVLRNANPPAVFSHPTPVYSPSGSLLFVGGYDLSELWRMPAGEYYGAIRLDSGTGDLPVLQLFTPDSRLIVTAHNARIQFWPVQPGSQEQPLLSYDQGFKRLESIAVSPDGKLIALGQDNGKVLVIRNPFVQFRFLSFARAGSQWVLRGYGGSGRYQLQQTVNLASPSWEHVGSPTTQTTFTVPTVGGSAFYRVQSLPE